MILFDFDWDAPLAEPERDALLQRIAESVVKRGMATPAIWMLDVHRPLVPLAGHMSIAFSPFIGTFFERGVYDMQKLTKLMQSRANVDKLIVLIEERERMGRTQEATVGARQ